MLLSLDIRLYELTVLLQQCAEMLEVAWFLEFQRRDQRKRASALKLSRNCSSSRCGSLCSLATRDQAPVGIKLSALIGLPALSQQTTPLPLRAVTGSAAMTAEGAQRDTGGGRNEHQRCSGSEEAFRKGKLRPYSAFVAHYSLEFLMHCQSLSSNRLLLPVPRAIHCL